MKYIFSYCCLLFLFSSLTIKGQDTLVFKKKYPNGNLLFEKSGYYELRTSDNKFIESWDDFQQGFKVNEIVYSTIYKRKNNIQKVGLICITTGNLYLNIEYDEITMISSSEGILYSRNAQKATLRNLISSEIIETDTQSINFLSGSYIIKKEDFGILFNEKLNIIDTIKGYIKTETIQPFNDLKKVCILFTFSGLLLKEADGKPIALNKDFTDVIAEWAGDNFIVTTKNGYGLYNYKSEQIIEPCINRTYIKKPFYNEQILFAENQKWKLFDSSGKKLLEIVADSIIPAIDGEWSGFFFKQKGLWGFVDVYGKILQKPIWKSMWNPRFDNFEGTLSNGKVINYYYDYKQVGGKQIITKVSSGTSMAAPPN